LNWDGSSSGVAEPPGPFDAVNITHVDGIARTVTYDVNAPTLGLLIINLTGLGTARTTFSMPANNLTTSRFLLGLNGRATFNQTGGTNTSTNSDGFSSAIGDFPGGDGIYNLTGTGALSIAGELWVGGEGTGRFNQTGGTTTTAIGQNLQLAALPGSVGTYELSGGTLSITANLIVGNQGTGTLRVTGGGKVSNGNGNIGEKSGSTGSVAVDGAGSVWTNSAVVAVGVFGSGTLNITRGGVVSSIRGRIAREAGSSGSVVIDGPGSRWNCSEVFTMGFTGTAQPNALDVRNGGVLSVGGGISNGPNGTIRGDGTIAGNLTNSGTVAPGNVNIGNSTDTMHITGDYSQGLSAGAGKLQINLAGPTKFGKLDVTGNVALGGTLEVTLAPGVVPVGTQFDILDWGGSRIGQFTNVNLPTLDGLITWDTSQLYTKGVLSAMEAASLPGDFNGDRTINAIDIDLLAAAAAQSAPNIPLYDLNSDGRVTFVVGSPGSPTPSDSDVLIRNILHTEYGDLNLDGQVFLSDLNTLAMNYRQAGLFGWAQGNVNGSQEGGSTGSPRIFLADLNALTSRWRFGVGSGAAIDAIPEPGSPSLGLCWLFATLYRRVRVS
jgi:T5SS/PEP-CTERM-associated repeat protein